MLGSFGESWWFSPKGGCRGAAGWGWVWMGKGLGMGFVGSKANLFPPVGLGILPPN